MLRAARFAAKLGFNLDPATEAPIAELSGLLNDVPAARLFEEVLKLFMGGMAASTFEKLRHFGLFEQLFPATEASLAYQEHDFPLTLVLKGLENTDSRIATGQPVAPFFLFAVLLWEPVRSLAESLQADGLAPYPALQQAANSVMETQLQQVSIPRRHSTPMREVWGLQSRFEQIRGKRPQRLATHPRFRAAYDFLLLRAHSGEADVELADWWTKFQEQNQPVASEQDKPKTGRSRRRRGGRRRKRPEAKPQE